MTAGMVATGLILSPLCSPEDRPKVIGMSLAVALLGAVKIATAKSMAKNKTTRRKAR